MIGVARIPAWALGILLMGSTMAQSYKLRIVGAEEGLTNSFVHALAQDADGYLWIGTGGGAARFDGQKVVEFTTDDSLSENYVSCIRATPDGTVWFGHNQGGITWWKNGEFHKVPVAGISASTINEMVSDGRGGIWAEAQNDGVIHVDAKGRVRLAAAAEGVLWYALLPLKNGNVVAGGSDGLHLFKQADHDSLVPIAGLDIVTHAPVRSLALSPKGKVLVGLEDEGILSFSLKGDTPIDIITLGEKEGLTELHVRDLVFGNDGQLIVGTLGQGAFEFELEGDQISSLQHYDSHNGLGTDNVEVVLMDGENNIWFARFGKGLARLMDRAVVYYASEEGYQQDIGAICVKGHDVWFGSAGRILHVRKDDLRRVDTLDARNGLPNDQISALETEPNGALWAGTEENGLYRQDAKGHFVNVPLASDLLSRKVHALARRGNAVWVATSNGVYIVDSGRTRHLTTENGLMHNQVNAVFTDTRGQVWLACNNGGVSVVKNDTVHSFTLTQQGNAYHVTGIAEDASGTMWFSTYGNGVWYSEGDLYRAVTAKQGLRSDYCYAIAADQKGSIWVAHRGGVSRINAKNHAVKTYDRQFGIVPDRRLNTVVADDDFTIWFGTDGGVIRYDTDKDKPILHPPPIAITAVKVFGRDVPTNQDLVLSPDIYRIQFDFLGISLKDPGAITYRFKLEGHDQDWTTTTQATALYMRVPDGNFIFKVQAAYADGSFSEIPATMRITVRTPFWKQHWFIALSIILVLLIIFSVVRIRERNQRIAKEHLQKALDERTHELMTKKEEIELKNKDITDSITYARRIQQAILPPKGTLTEQFPHAFIIFQPRNIVSGDFYWFRRFGSKFILACADCTGHGVPGAFMSMIGSMLLREVSADQEVWSPDVLLQKLDTELRTVLQYQAEDLSNHDGMDISLCEIDVESRSLRFAAAMHDVLIVRDGKLIRERGNRRSIGGALTVSAPQDFDLKEMQLAPGDRIYLFSDGLADQFGGAKGKKLKVAGIMAMLEELATLSMEDQSVKLRERFKEWIGDHDQVDDMILIGIEV